MSDEDKRPESHFSEKMEGVSQENLKETLKETVPPIVKATVPEELANLQSEVEKVKETIKTLNDRTEVRDTIFHTLEDINARLLDNVQENYDAIETFKQSVSRQRELLQYQADIIKKQSLPHAYQEKLVESGTKYPTAATIKDTIKRSTSIAETISPLVAEAIEYWQQEAEKEKEDARANGYHDLTGTHNVICLDVSNSMKEGDTWSQAENFFKDYLKGMAKLKKGGIDHENVALVTFGGEVRVQERLTKDFEKLQEKIDKLTPSGPTQMFGGLLIAEAVALTSKFSFAIANDVHIRPKIIFITDGKPTGIIPFSAEEDIGNPDTTEMTKGQIIKEVKRIKLKQVDIHCVYVGQGDSSAEEFLRSVSRASVNKKVMSSTDGKELSYQNFSKTGLLSLLKILSPDDDDDDDDISSLLDLPDISKLEKMIESQRNIDFYQECDDKRYPEIGKRVRRSRNWMWGDQDSNGVGTIIGHSPDSMNNNKTNQLWVWVEWDANGKQNAYRWGHGSSKKSDLMIVDEERLLEPGELLAVGIRVRKGDTDDDTTETGVVIKFTEEDEKALVRWKDKSRGEYYFGKNETPTVVVPVVTKGTKDKTVISSASQNTEDQSGIPSPPKGSVDVTNVLRHSADLEWNKPDNEGSSPVTHFEIKFREKEKEWPVTIDREKAGPARISHKLVHLKGNTEYVAFIRAVNNVGYSKQLTVSPFCTCPYSVMDNEEVQHTLMTEKYLAHFIDAIGSDWDFVAIQLGINRVITERVRSDNSSAAKQVFNMLMTWRQQEAGKATFGELIKRMKLARATYIDWNAVEEIAKNIKIDIEKR